jgi:hypothetical protein
MNEKKRNTHPSESFGRRFKSWWAYQIEKPLIFEVSGFFAYGHCTFIAKVLNLVAPVQLNI